MSPLARTASIDLIVHGAEAPPIMNSVPRTTPAANPIPITVATNQNGAGFLVLVITGSIRGPAAGPEGRGRLSCDYFTPASHSRMTAIANEAISAASTAKVLSRGFNSLR